MFFFGNLKNWVEEGGGGAAKKCETFIFLDHSNGELYKSTIMSSWKHLKLSFN